MKDSNNDNSNFVFYISLVSVGILILAAIFVPDIFSKMADRGFNFITQQFGWLYTLATASFVVFCLFIISGKKGEIVLGDDGDKPEYSTFSWFSMLFSCGMGIGLVFWGVAEPLNFFVNPYGGLESGSEAAAAFALKKSFFHWGFQPWAIYSTLGLGIAYMSFRKKKKALISSVLIPIIGEKNANGALGKFVDILAIFATVGGVVTSFGLAAQQSNSGLNFLFGVPDNLTVKIIIITVITILFMTSALTGLSRGIKWLSNFNVVVAITLMLLTFIIGPSIFILIRTTSAFGDYLSSLLRDSFLITKESFFTSWTIFYWAWWIAWAPFVAPFIARISRGRTVREFVLGVLIAPTLASVLWFGIFGSVGIEAGLGTAKEAIANTPTALFLIFSQYNFGSILSFIAFMLIISFYVTSADSATFVLGMLSSNGNKTPSKSKRIVWGLAQALLAVALLVITQGKGLGMIQTASIVAAFPFMFVMIFSMYAVYKSLNDDVRQNEFNKK